MPVDDQPEEGAPVAQLQPPQPPQPLLELGTRVRHRERGLGTVTEILMDDSRTRVAFDNGEEHRYRPASLHKLVAVAEKDNESPSPMRRLSRSNTVLSQVQDMINSKFSKGATHMLLYLNKETFVGTAGKQLAVEVRAALKMRLKMLLVHEQDEDRGGVEEFGRFLHVRRH